MAINTGRNVTVNVDGFKHIQREVRRMGAQASFQGPTGDMFKQWGALVLGFWRRRFVRNSGGGGDWQPLKAATVKRRKQGKNKGRGSAQILRNNGHLISALDVDGPGNLHDPVRGGVKVGIGGPARHPDSKTASIADIARFHDQGAGNNPERQIIVKPDVRTLKLMERVAAKTLEKIARAGERKMP